VLVVNDTKKTMDDMMYPIYERESMYLPLNETYQYMMGSSVWDVGYQGDDSSVEAGTNNSDGLKIEIMNKETEYEILYQEAEKAGYKITEDEEKEFRALLEKLGFNYKEELIRIFTEENVKKVQIIIYALKRLFTSNRKSLLYKITREELLFIYDKCIEKQLEYENTEDEINNFLDYYYVSLIKSLRKS